MGARTVVIGLSVGRAVVGGALVAAPAKAAAAWIGPEAALPSSQVLTRAIGGRDLALALGTLAAVTGDEVRLWLAACVLADATDFAATAIAGKALPPAGRVGTMALAAGATVAGLALLRNLR
ncbi:MAG: hypothetical protein ACR2ML_02075 [Solirubrobacteraceae bacterium]